MAARRASAQFLTIFQRSNVSASVQPLAVPRQATALTNRRLHSESQAKLDNEHTEEYESDKMTAEGGGNPRYEFSENSGTKGQVEKSVDTAKDKVKDIPRKVSETVENSETKGQVEKGVDTAKDKFKEVSETVENSETKGQVEKSVDTAKDKSKDVSQEVSETVTGLKEVAVEAAKSVKRDADKVAQKVGLKSEE